ncbi:MAG: hypothetical protein L3J17_06335 [Candidatus Jettenia sp.]|nr:MAG: hypothetical protein L3J17_06335 [Candidatus Jettenia sp.]
MEVLLPKLSIDISDRNYLFMNYTFQDAEDDNGNDLPFSAQHKGNFRVNVHCSSPMGGGSYPVLQIGGMLYCE